MKLVTFSSPPQDDQGHITLLMDVWRYNVLATKDTHLSFSVRSFYQGSHHVDMTDCIISSKVELNL